MGGCAICSRLRGRHAGEGGEAAARSFEEFMESTFPRGLDSTGPLVSPHYSFAAPPFGEGLVKSTLQPFSRPRIASRSFRRAPSAPLAKPTCQSNWLFSLTCTGHALHIA